MPKTPNLRFVLVSSILELVTKSKILTISGPARTYLDNTKNNFQFCAQNRNRMPKTPNLRFVVVSSILELVTKSKILTISGPARTYLDNTKNNFQFCAQNRNRMPKTPNLRFVLVSSILELVTKSKILTISGPAHTYLDNKKNNFQFCAQNRNRMPKTTNLRFVLVSSILELVTKSKILTISGPAHTYLDNTKNNFQFCAQNRNRMPKTTNLRFVLVSSILELVTKSKILTISGPAHTYLDNTKNNFQFCAQNRNRMPKTTNLRFVLVSSILELVTKSKILTISGPARTYLDNKKNNFQFCAQNRNRTCTYLRTLVPETSASTNSAIWALTIFS